MNLKNIFLLLFVSILPVKSDALAQNPVPPTVPLGGKIRSNLELGPATKLILERLDNRRAGGLLNSDFKKRLFEFEFGDKKKQWKIGYRLLPPSSSCKSEGRG
jgi:hypothetical protein